MKLAHRPRIASTMIKLISKPILQPILLILVKTIQRIVADPKCKLSPPFDSADSVPSLGHPAPGSSKMLLLFTVLCDYSVWMTETGAPGSGKRFSQSEFCSTISFVVHFGGVGIVVIGIGIVVIGIGIRRRFHTFMYTYHQTFIQEVTPRKLQTLSHRVRNTAR